MKSISSQKGFTLVEVMIALGVFSFGVVAMMVMQGTGIKGNATANTITTASTLAGDRIERIFGMNHNPMDAYNVVIDLDNDGDNDELTDQNGDGVVDAYIDRDDDKDAGLNDATAATADYTAANINNTGTTFYWNVATDFPMKQTDTLRIIVTRLERGVTRQVVFDYITADIIDN